MLLQEAEWLHDRLAEFPLEAISPLLNLGSSTRKFREVQQPFIAERVFDPLSRRGCRVHHVDLKAADGVDIVADLFDDAECATLRGLQPRAVLNSNLLEHVRDPADALARSLALLPAGGVLFLTVPYSFPYHADPIDTLFRPSPARMRRMLEGQDIRRCEIVAGGTLMDEVRARRDRRAADEPTFGDGWRPRWQTFLHLFWLWRTYKMTCAVAIKR
jgi:hypothetical protein